MFFLKFTCINQSLHHILVTLLHVSLFRKTKGFDLQEKLVYQIIEEAGNKGKVIMLPKKIAFKIMNKK